MYASRENSKKHYDTSSNEQPSKRDPSKSDLRATQKMPQILSPYVAAQQNLYKNSKSTTNQTKPANSANFTTSKFQTINRPVHDESGHKTHKSLFTGPSANRNSSSRSGISQDTRRLEKEKEKEREGNRSPSTGSTRTKQFLRLLTSKAEEAQQTQNEPQKSASSAVTSKVKKSWPSDPLPMKKHIKKISMFASEDKGLRRKKTLRNNTDIMKSSHLMTSSRYNTEREEASIPDYDIGDTRHSLRESGVVRAYAANTNQGLVRTYNEDRVSIVMNISRPANTGYKGEWPACSFFAIYDGHGGASCADFLRDNLHQMIVRDINFPLDPEEAIKRGFAEAEAKFTEKAEAKREFDRSGSCAIVVLIVGMV